MNDLIRFFQICVESSTWPDYVKNEKNKIQSGYYDSENNDLKNEFEKYLDQFDWEKDKDIDS
jgi:hypothetical protein